MRAVQFDVPGGPLRVVDVPAPACPADGVVVAVGATGLCRSDWHAWQGNEPVALPHVPGHELAGTIVETGPAVRRWRPGQRVTVPFVLACGVCATCRSGHEQVCEDQRQPGFTGPGCFAELVALERADVNLVALPDALDDVAAASLGCRFSTAFRALTVHGRVTPGDWVSVHGCGGVGLAAVMIAVALDAHVVAVDPSEQRRAAAQRLGAAVTLAPEDAATTAARVVEATGGGAHVSVDAVGSADAVVAGVNALRPRGRHVQVGLLHGTQATPPIPMDLVIARELAIHGSHGMAAHEYPAMLALIAAGRLDPGALVARVISLHEAPAAMAAMAAAQDDGLTVILPHEGR